MPGDIRELLEVMARLRDPRTGCPWDREQTFASIAPYTIEEACEVADAIERHDLMELRDELGDLLFQVVFHARMAEEQGEFGFSDFPTAAASRSLLPCIPGPVSWYAPSRRPMGGEGRASFPAGDRAGRRPVVWALSSLQ